MNRETLINCSVASIYLTKVYLQTKFALLGRLLSKLIKILFLCFSVTLEKRAIATFNNSLDTTQMTIHLCESVCQLPNVFSSSLTHK